MLVATCTKCPSTMFVTSVFAALGKKNLTLVVMAKEYCAYNGKADAFMLADFFGRKLCECPMPIIILCV